MENIGKKQLGQIGEIRAREFLENNEYEIIKVNYYTTFGEIDLIALNDNCLCFVEVRLKSDKYLIHPFESITKKKKRNIINSANYYVLENNADLQIRFDVLGIIKKDDNFEFELLKNAFEID